MKKVYVKGYYGYKNIGDDIFIVTAKWIFDNYFKSSQPIFIGENIPNMPSDSRIWTIKNHFVKRLAELYMIFRVDSILYYGGSLFQDGGADFLNIKFYLRKLNFFSNKVLTIGTSLGPFENLSAFERTKELLKKFKYIGLRDYSSVEISNEMGLDKKTSFVFDNAILVNEVFPELDHITNSTQDELKIGVSLCRYESLNGKSIETEKEREKAIYETLDTLLEDNDKISEVTFFVFNGHETRGDLEITNEFKKRIEKKVKVSVVDYTADTFHFLKEMKKCQFILGVRLHSGILAYALDIPFMLVEYHKKCTEFLNTVRHPYKFSIKNTNKNIENIKTLIDSKEVPGIKEPEYFKSKMLEELEYLGSNNLI